MPQFTLRVVVYAPNGLAVGYVKQIGEDYEVELLGPDGSAGDGGRFVSLLSATKVLLNVIDGED